MTEFVRKQSYLSGGSSGVSHYSCSCNFQSCQEAVIQIGINAIRNQKGA